MSNLKYCTNRTGNSSPICKISYVSPQNNIPVWNIVLWGNIGYDELFDTNDMFLWSKRCVFMLTICFCWILTICFCGQSDMLTICFWFILSWEWVVQPSNIFHANVKLKLIINNVQIDCNSIIVQFLFNVHCNALGADLSYLWVE